VAVLQLETSMTALELETDVATLELETDVATHFRGVGGRRGKYTVKFLFVLFN
jgi:hypothetical protein